MPDTRLVTQSKDVFISERPIIWQAWLDLREFSKGQVIPASIMTVAAFIAALVTGQVTSAGSALLFILCSVVAGVVFYALIAILRAPLIVIGHHHRQLSDLNLRLIEMEAKSVSAAPAPVALSLLETHAQIDATSFEFTNSLIVDRWLTADKPGRLSSAEPNDAREAEMLKYPVMLARFYYKPAHDVFPYINVKAHLAIADAQGVPIQSRYDAVWDESSENAYKVFNTADTHALAIALLPKDPSMPLCTYQYGFRDGRFLPVFETIPGKEFVLHLELIGKVNTINVLNARLRFLLSLEPQPTLEFLG